VSLAAKRKRNKQQFKAAPRLATHKHVLRIDRYIEMYSDSGLEMFQNVCKLKKLNLFEGCATGKFPDVTPKIPTDLTVECFCFVSDQEQSQIAGGEFIVAAKSQGGLECTGVRFSDDFHRWNNDLESAVAKSGLAAVEKAATLIFNIGYGPWQKAAFYHMIIASGTKISQTLQPNSRLVLKFWPRHLVDVGLQDATSDDVVGEAGRRAYVAAIPEQNLMNLKGVKVSPSAWMSFQKAGASWNSSLATRALVLSSLCLEKGWIVTEEDLFSTTRMGADAYGDKPDNQSGDKPATTSKAAAHRCAKAKLDALKARTANTFVAATKLLCDIDVINGIRVILHGSKAQWTGFNAMVSDLTSPAKTLSFNLRWSQQEWLEPLKGTLRCLTDIPGLVRCGFECDFKIDAVNKMKLDSARVLYQNALAKRLGRFVDTLLELRAGSLAQRTFYCPFKLVGLTATSQSVRTQTMKEFEKDVRALWAAKELHSAMYVCMHACMYICMYACMYVCLCE
jgi:hypothetical protein